MPEYEVLREHLGDRMYLRGETRVAEEIDVTHLVRNEVLRPAGDGLADGPTIAEFVAAGYPASAYPPRGYASRSTAEEIAAAIAAQTSLPAPGPLASVAPLTSAPSDPADAAHGTGTATQEPETMTASEKAAQAPANKAAPLPANKAAATSANKSKD